MRSRGLDTTGRAAFRGTRALRSARKRRFRESRACLATARPAGLPPRSQSRSRPEGARVDKGIKTFNLWRLLRGKRPEDLERGEEKEILSTVVLPGLAEADEAEAPAPGSAEREVADHAIIVQVFVVLAAIDDLPRPPTSPRLRPRGPTTWGSLHLPLSRNSSGPRATP